LISDPDRPLLLKNPWDYFMNYIYLKEVFPDSKFIFIHRHPIRIINSQLKAIRSALMEKNEYVALIAGWYRQLFQQPLRLYWARLMFSSYFNLGLRITTRHVSLATNYFLSHISQLSERDYISVRYEDLCQDPQLTIGQIMDALELKVKKNLEYQSLIVPRSDELLAEVKKNQTVIYKKMKRYCEYFGYQINRG
jgi:hypothetical protein